MKNKNIVVSDNMYPRIMLYRPSPRGWLCEVMFHAGYSELSGPYEFVEEAVRVAIEKLALKTMEEEEREK